MQMCTEITVYQSIYIYYFCVWVTYVNDRIIMTDQQNVSLPCNKCHILFPYELYNYMSINYKQKSNVYIGDAEKWVCVHHYIVQSIFDCKLTITFVNHVIHEETQNI